MYESDSDESTTRAAPVYPALPLHAAPRPSELSQVLWRGRWWIAVSVLLGAAAGYLFWQHATPEYESRARLLIGKPGMRLDPALPQPLGSSSSNYIQTQASLIMTREILEPALGDPNVLALPGLALLADRLGTLASTLTVEVSKGTDLISISARSERPEEPAVLVNAVVRAYVRWHAANRQVGTADLLKDLNTQLDNRLRELEAKRKERMLFEQRHPEAVESIRGGVVLKTLELLRQDLATARLNAIQQEAYQKRLLRFQSDPAKFRQYVASQRPPGFEVAENGEREALAAALYQNQLQIAVVTAGQTMLATDVNVVKNTGAQIEKRLATLDQDFIQGHIALAQVVFEDAAAREQQLSKMYEAELAKVQSVGSFEAEYAFLNSECTLMENLCSGLMTQISNLDLNSHLEGPTTRVLEAALPSTRPVWPRMPVVLAVSLIGGLALGVGLAFLRDWRDQTVRSATEVTSILGVPVLGAIPSMSRRRFAARGQRLRLDPNCRESEAYRSIRTSLFLGTPREHGSTILVTSPGPLEGKTTLVSNLGIAMAQAGQKTLIMDADLRRPMQHNVFKMGQSGPGLTDVLMGTASWKEAIQHTEIKGLDVLLSGQRTSCPSELLNSQAFADVLEQLKEEYDRVLVDSSPVGIVTDPQILASACGLTLLVLRANRSSRLLTQRAGDALWTVGARIVGVVVNGVSRKDNQYSHYWAMGSYQSRYSSGGGKTVSHELPPAAAVTPETGP
jgi:polysaccharide biosynthesis transport protein